MKSGVFETKLTIRNVIDQLNEQLKQKPEESQFYGPLKAFPDSIGAADKERLTAQTRAMIGENAAVNAGVASGFNKGGKLGARAGVTFGF